jgi:hypothetical protein
VTRATLPVRYAAMSSFARLLPITFTTNTSVYTLSLTLQRTFYIRWMPDGLEQSLEIPLRSDTALGLCRNDQRVAEAHFSFPRGRISMA